MYFRLARPYSEMTSEEHDEFAVMVFGRIGEGLFSEPSESDECLHDE